jgi:hypothetical protein
VRGIYPVVATVTVSGYEQVSEVEVAERFAATIERLRGAGRQ